MSSEPTPKKKDTDKEDGGKEDKKEEKKEEVKEMKEEKKEEKKEDVKHEVKTENKVDDMDVTPNVNKEEKKSKSEKMEKKLTDYTEKEIYAPVKRADRELVSETVEKYMMKLGTVTAEKGSFPKPNVLKWLLRNGYKEFYQYSVSPYQLNAIFWLDYKLPHMFTNRKDFFPVMIKNACEMARERFGILVNIGRHEMNEFGLKIPVADENNVFVSPKFREDIYRNDNMRLQYDNRTKTTNRAMTTTQKVLVANRQFKFRDFITFVPLDEFSRSIDPGFFSYVKTPLQMVDFLMNVSTPYHIPSVPDQTSQENYYLLPEDGPISHFSDVFRSSPLFRSKVQSTAESIVKTIFEIQGTDTMQVFKNIENLMERSIVERLPTSEFGAQIVTQNAIMVLQQLVSAHYCKIIDRQQGMVSDAIRFRFRPNMDLLDPLVFFACLSYLSILPSTLRDDESIDNCKTYIFRHHTSRFKIDSFTQNVTINQFTADRKLPDKVVNAAKGLNSQVGAGGQTNSSPLTFPFSTYQQFIQGNTAGPIPDLFNINPPPLGFLAPPGFDVTSKDGQVLLYPFKPIPNVPGEYIGYYDIVYNYLLAVERFRHLYSSNREASMYFGVSRVFRGMAQQFMAYYKSMTMMIQYFQRLGFGIWGRVSDPVIIDLSALDLFSLIGKLDFTRIYVSEQIYDVFIWSRGIRRDMEVYLTLMDIVWNKTELNHLISREERIKLLDEMTSILKDWFSTDFLERFSSAIKEQYTPRPVYNNKYRDAIEHCLDRLLARLPEFGYTNRVYYMPKYTTALLNGHEFVTAGQALKLDGTPLNVVDRLNAARFKSLAPGSSIFDNEINWVEFELMDNKDQDNLDSEIKKSGIIDNIRKFNKIKVDVRYRWNDYALDIKPQIQFEENGSFTVPASDVYMKYHNLTPAFFGQGGTRIRFMKFEKNYVLDKVPVIKQSQPFY